MYKIPACIGDLHGPGAHDWVDRRDGQGDSSFYELWLQADQIFPRLPLAELVEFPQGAPERPVIPASSAA